MGVQMELSTIAVVQKHHRVDFVVSPTGFVTAVQKGGIGPIPTDSPGMQFFGGGGGNELSSAVYVTRIMSASTTQGARSVYENDSYQKINPFTGRTVGNDHSLAHLYHNAHYSKLGKL